MYVLYLYFQLSSHAFLFDSEQEEHEEAEVAKMNVYTAVGSLIAITVVTAFCADYLVESIDEFSTDYGVPKVFIGIILLPIGWLRRLINPFSLTDDLVCSRKCC